MKWTLRAAVLLLPVCSPAAFAAEAKSVDLAGADAGNKAFVLFSTSAEHTNAVAGTYARLQRVELKANGKRRYRFIEGFMTNNAVLKSQSATEFMHVYWRTLEPGDYVLERILAHPMACFQTYEWFAFTVVAGSSVYLGDFHVTNEGDFVVRDAYVRDYAFFQANAAGFKPAEFVPALPEQQLKPDYGCEHHL